MLLILILELLVILIEMMKQNTSVSFLFEFKYTNILVVGCTFSKLIYLQIYLEL